MYLNLGVNDRIKPTVSIIVAVGRPVSGAKYPIGKDNGIPWHNPADMKWFRETTMGHTVIMGRKTYDSIGKPLDGRYNIIVSSQCMSVDESQDSVWVSSLDDAIVKSLERRPGKDIFIIGGESIYRQAIESGLVGRIYIDHIDKEVRDADRFFPVGEITTENGWFPVIRDLKVGEGARVWVYERRRTPLVSYDQIYCGMVRDIIGKGEVKKTRAGRTRSMFGKMMKWDLHRGLPVLTTKKMYMKGVIHELLWFLKGETNIKYLVDNNVHIWDDDAYRFYIEVMRENFDIDGDESYLIETGGGSVIRKGILPKTEFVEGVRGGWRVGNLSGKVSGTYVFGDLNNIYGYQWRRWGGHDQIKEVIAKLRANPDDRRIMVSAWNVGDIPSMALPPCHYGFQFYASEMSERERWDYFERNVVSNFGPDAYYTLTHSRRPDYQKGKLSRFLDLYTVPTRKLSCMFNMRSVDFILGLPFNMMSYSVLTHMVAQCANMDVGEVIFVGGDCHVYENQIDTFMNIQDKRSSLSYPLPVLHLNPYILDIDGFGPDDITVEGYKSHPAVKYPLSVGL